MVVGRTKKDKHKGNRKDDLMDKDETEVGKREWD